MRKLIGLLALSRLALSWQGVCGQGQLSVGEGCGECPYGYGSYGDTTECYNCASGQYLYENGICLPCPSGTYTLFDDGENGIAYECTACSEGSTNFGTGNSGCYNCDAGEYLVSNSQCDYCPVGTYSAGGDVLECTICPENQANFGTGNTACYSCQPGQYIVDNSDCDYCPAGTYSTSGAALECTVCPEGSTNIGSANTACYSCQPGQYMVGNQECDYCPSGTTSSGGAALECTSEDSNSF